MRRSSCVRHTARAGHTAAGELVPAKNDRGATAGLKRDENGAPVRSHLGVLNVAAMRTAWARQFDLSALRTPDTIDDVALVRRFFELSTPWRLTFVGLLFCAIVAFDFWTGSDVTLRASYLIPVTAAAWSVGKRSALAFSVFSVALCSYFDFAGHTRLRPAFIYSDAIVRFLVYTAATLLLVRLQRVQIQLDALAQKDPLTGINNRRAFEQAAARELRRAHRQREAITLVHIDLDGFKEVNDRHGHAAGDQVLREVSSILVSGRGMDIAARLGGDEFVLLMPGTNASQAASAVQRIRERLHQAMVTGGRPITFSVGVATFCQPPNTVDEMLVAADSLMYSVKRSKKDGVRFQSIGAHP